MKVLIPVLLAGFLTGCITIAMPPQQPSPPQPPVVTEKVVRVCKPYQPPVRKKIPRTPQVAEQRGDYVKNLEETAERLADHVSQLRDYIIDEHEIEDEAQRQHLQSCEP